MASTAFAAAKFLPATHLDSSPRLSPLRPAPTANLCFSPLSAASSSSLLRLRSPSPSGPGGKLPPPPRSYGGGGGSGDAADSGGDGRRGGILGLFLAGWAARVTAHPQFPFKVLMEELVGVSAACSATWPPAPTSASMADVDDDVLGADPTAHRFETEMARIMGKEAALFVPSGTMANLISVLVHCDTRGSVVILGDNSHIHMYENGGISTIGGVHPKTVRNNPDGTMDIDKIVSAIRHSDGALYYPTTRLICLENTHANCGGKCLSVEYTDKVGEVAKSHGLKLHIDGARIFNASVTLGVPVHRLVKAADSVSVCLSKGLGTPVGSVIVGSKGFIDKAKILRKTLGGGMRQVGILCAATYVAVRDTVGKLADDHRKAKVLADGLKKIKQFTVDSTSVETNMILNCVLIPKRKIKYCGLVLLVDSLQWPGVTVTTREALSRSEGSCTSEVIQTLPYLKKAYGNEMQKVLHVGPDSCTVVSNLLKEGKVEAWGVEPCDLEDADSSCKSLVRKGFVRMADIKFPLPYRPDSFNLVVVSDALDYLTPRYLNKTLPDLARISTNGLVIFAGNPGQQKAKVSELSKFGRPAKLRSSSWWTRYFIQTGLTKNEGPLKKFKKAAAKNKYKPDCQIFHLSS